MKIKTRLLRNCLTFFAIIFFVQKIYAGSDNPIISILDGSKNQIAKDSFASAKDTLFFSTTFSSNLVKPYPVKDVITFHINEQFHTILPSTFTAIVHLRVIYTNASNHKDSLNDVRLVLNYNSSSTYTARASFIFSGAYQVKIRVLSDTISSSVISALMIDNEIIPNRIYTYACTGKDITQITVAGTTADELTVSWSNVIGADQTDLEWTYIDSAALASGIYTTNGNLDPNLIFDNNSTRVSISDLSYNIPLIFSGPGSVFVRVRPVHFSNGNRIISNWSSNYSPNGMLKYNYVGHEKRLNWQSSIAFAEDGKRKVVVQYFDGTLRNHQTVTKDNSNNTTITAETFYDYQGRPAIQVLPSPSVNTIIQYTKNFNKINGAEYDKSYFDSVVSPNTLCAMHAPAMDSSFGAALYYSANYPHINGDINNYIPESYGYAFTQTEYTQDNTGRINRQGGVGQEFQLNTGHETRYSYSITPDQNELDALFGTEAGDHTHYFKNSVRDANGQYSVSYVDMHGRTIATALAGDAPAGLTALSSNVPLTITETLSDASTNYIDGMAMISHKSMLVEKAGSQHFIYSLSPQTLQLFDCNSNQVCYDCLYDLTITITDDCGNQKIGGHPILIRRPNFSIADALCNGNSIAVDTTITLDEGNYEITKSLSVNEKSHADYLSNIYLPHNTCKSASNFITSQLQSLHQENCTVTCTSCRESIGTYSSFSANYMTSVYGSTTGMSLHQNEIQTAYNNALASCDTYCNDTVYSQTDFIKQAMLADMSPKTGQYANLDSTWDFYSIFSDLILFSDPIYQLITDYKNEQGDLDSVWDNVTQTLVPPQQLDATQFAENFKPTWANSLLPSHPEYCKLVAYQSHYDSYTWDKQFQATTSYSAAIAKGYNNPITTGTHRDPLAGDATFSTDLSTKYSSYTSSTKDGVTKTLTMWQFAILNVKCPDGDTDCIQNIVFDTQDYSLSCTGDSNKAWKNFQNLYIAYKTELLNQYYAGLTCTFNGANVTTQDLLDHHHHLNFNTSSSVIGINGLGFTSSTNQQEIKDSAAAHIRASYQSNCEDYKSIWTEKLVPGYSTSQINQILPMLVDVCVTGADQNHPFGSRDISTDSPSVYENINGNDYWNRSFDDVINNFNAEYNITQSQTQTADVITVPFTYYSRQAYDKPISTTPTQSECDNINLYYALYEVDGYFGETFSEYLKRTQNTDISKDDLDLLLNSCNVSSDCKYLDHPVLLPPIFQSDIGNPCTDCNVFANLINAYINIYGNSLYPEMADQTDTVQLKKNQLFTNFMNNQLGYNLNIADYLDFMNQCGSSQAFARSSSSSNSSDDTPMLCGKLSAAFPRIPMDTINSCTDSTFFAVSTGTELYNHYLDSLKKTFDSLYLYKCFKAYNYETFTVTHTVNEYQYTLYYYDQAGNLVQTIPPKAVNPNWNNTYLAQVKSKRATSDTLRPGHNLVLATEYRYNTLNQVVSQKTPDAGTSNFYYDRLGRLVISQNAKQAPLNKFSYTNYDLLGRITEVGELTNASALNSSISKTPSQLQSWLTAANASRTQITQTTYDTVYFGIDGIVLNAKNLRNRVSYTQYFAVASDQTSAKPKAGTYYSYDIEGNVDTLLQDYTIPSLPTNSNRFFKKIVYQYDLISGKVNSVTYNPGNPDVLYQRYTYDAENRITNAETSIDSIYWENEAYYKYYLHGLLARTQLGEQQIQGEDYAYTLQGWLKGINTSDINSSFDMGKDGFISKRIDIAKDAFGFALHYFATDYKAISGSSLPFAAMNTTVLSSFKPLYNGNIAAMSENLSSFSKPLLFNYGYDQLNRLTQMQTFKNNSAGFSLSSNVWNLTAINDYNEDVAYDPNGNILKYKRYGNSTNTGLTNALLMDSLSYNYQANSNRLDWIKDSVASTRFSTDIDNQNIANYSYDGIGNLIKDTKENIDSIAWNVYGKIQKINKHDGTVITYTYDASGNRIGKVITGSSAGNGETWYVHDASGNVMAVYTVNDNTVNSGALTLSEQAIYGSSRLGVYKPALNLISYTPPALLNMNSLGSVGYNNTFIRGKKFFELANHLGNVLVTISDKKLAVDNTNDGVIDYYQADIVTANDYYPGGMTEPGRSYTANNSSYRYGFNGKEKDPNITSEDYDYGFRIYDARVVRFLSTDPLTKKYPELTPYQFASNRFIDGIDLDGLEYIKPIPKFGYSHDAYDASKGFDNAFIGFANGFIGLYNSGVDTYKSLKGGTYVQDVTTGAKQFGLGVKQTVTNSINYSLHTPVTKQFTDVVTNPENIELGVGLYLGYKALPTGNKGNLLAPTVVNTASLTATEKNILSDAQSILNSKDFEILKTAYKNGVAAEIKVGNRPVIYEPSFTYGHAMTLKEENGFLLGPNAFSSEQELNHTVLWEVTRLNTQNVGGLNVEQTAPFTENAQQTADKLLPLLEKKK